METVNRKTLGCWALLLWAPVVCTAATPNAGQLAADAETSRQQYGSCLSFAWREYNIPTFSPTEVAAASLSKCDEKLKSLRTTTMAALLAENPNRISFSAAEEATRKKSAELRERYRDQIIQHVIDLRAGKSLPQKTK